MKLSSLLAAALVALALAACSSSDSSNGAPVACGNVTCSATQYCHVVVTASASSSGNTKTPDGCRAYPASCTPSNACSCLLDALCPNNSSNVVSCSSDNGSVTFGCN